MAQTKHTAEWHLSTRNIYSAKFSLFLKLVYPSYTHCIPDIYPLYTWYIPIVYPSYTQAHQFRIEWAWNSLLVHQLHGIGCSGPSTETSFRIHKGIGIEVESSFHLQLWSFIKIFNLTNFYGHTQMVFQEILPWVYGVPAPSPVKRPYFSSARWHIGTSWLNALQWWPN